jgi:hypothetical protein
MLLILDVAPEERVEGPQRIHVESREAVAESRNTAVLEPETDRVDALNEHPLFEPV